MPDATTPTGTEQTGEKPTGQEPAETLESLRADRDKWRGFARQHEDMWKAAGRDPKELKALVAAEKRLRDAEDADKSELQKATEKVTSAETRATTAEANALRFEVALDLGLPKALAKRLQGSTREELEADAKELQKSLGITPTPGSAAGPTRPKEALRPGAAPAGEPAKANQVINDQIRGAILGHRIN